MRSIYHLVSSDTSHLGLTPPPRLPTQPPSIRETAWLNDLRLEQGRRSQTLCSTALGRFGTLARYQPPLCNLTVTVSTSPHRRRLN